MGHPGSLRERKKLQARLELVRAAVELFQARGFEATTVEDIVELANYSKSTFFRCFRSKEDVVFVDIPQLATIFEARLRAHRPDEDPWEFARQALTEQVLHFTGDAPELELQCVELWFTEPALRRRYGEIIGHWEAIAAQFFQRAWGPSAKLQAHIAAIMLIGVGRAVVEAQESDQAAVRSLFEAGFALVEGGITSHHEAQPTGPALTAPAGAARPGTPAASARGTGRRRGGTTSRS